jgi:hypothetical protein
VDRAAIATVDRVAIATVDRAADAIAIAIVLPRRAIATRHPATP